MKPLQMHVWIHSDFVYESILKPHLHHVWIHVQAVLNPFLGAGERTPEAIIFCLAPVSPDASGQDDVIRLTLMEVPEL